MSTKKRWHIYALLFGSALILRACVFYTYLSRQERYWQVDSTMYQQAARSLALGDGYTIGQNPVFYRLPGYSAFLALWYKLFGIDPLYALWVQVLLASLIPVFIFVLAHRVNLSRSASLCAAWLSVMHLGLVLYAGFLMTEILFLLFFLPFLIYLLPAFTMKRSRVPILNLVLAGAFLGCSSLVRPVGHYVLTLVGILLVLVCRPLTRALSSFGMVSLGWCAVAGVWLLRNYMLTGVVFFHTLPGGHFLYLSASRVAMHEHNCSYWQARDLLCETLQAQVRNKEQLMEHTLKEIEVCNEAGHLARSYFMRNPRRALQYWLTDIMRTTFSLYSAELLYLESGRKKINYFEKGRPLWSLFRRYFLPDASWPLRGLVWWEILFSVFVLLGALGTMFVVCDVSLLVRTMPFIALFLIIALAGGYARMRLPVEPLLFILAGRFWGEYLETRHAS